MIAKRTVNVMMFITCLLIAACATGAETLDNALLKAVVLQEEKALKARIGVAVMDTASGQTLSYRGHERFPLNSTHKPLLCGLLLSKVDAGELSLTDSIRFKKETLVDYSPVTEKFVAPRTMNWQEVCQAAVAYSDNTAANLIAKSVGGPPAVNHFLAAIGDNITRSDRFEPELNTSQPGDLRDTTTPVAISQTLYALTLGKVLQPASRQQLLQWMFDDKVADALLRSVLPPHWKIADKSGAGAYGSRSIISVVWPEKREPLIVVVYITQTEATMAQSNAAIARIGKTIFAATEAKKN
ncbi:class A beta-lactamase [[Erwinia] mediterraneensis]|uniref:class A beta-lactamase n=1 Tax=[Erwinia] mediterraneensis TaxID=2161819 RepID=UPI001EEF50B2|nr:class A beta-lactamase [[Erwinia] mediterraneensis]